MICDKRGKNLRNTLRNAMKNRKIRVIFPRRKNYMAYRKKYKPCILKYKALILKYVPYIFRCYKYLINNNL